MESLPGKAVSYWLDSTFKSRCDILKDGIKVDVAVLGGGIAGLNIALRLKESGLKVAVIEAREIGSGVTGHTTAHISSAHDLIYADLEKNFGKDGARIYGEANQTAIGQIAAVVKRYKIDCDFRSVSEYVYAERNNDLEILRQEFESAQRAGLPVSYQGSAPLPFPTAGAIRYSDQAEFHPQKYLLRLAEIIDREGSYVFEHSRALDVEVGEQCASTMEHHTCRSGKNILNT